MTPGVLPKLIRIMRDPNKGSEEIMSAISTDPSIVAGVLKLANSSLYAPPNPMMDLSETVSLFGIKEIYRIVSNVTTSSFLDGELTSLEIGKGGLWTPAWGSQSLWRRSLRTKQIWKASPALLDYFTI